jgi:hypothetical protein
MSKFIAIVHVFSWNYRATYIYINTTGFVATDKFTKGVLKKMPDVPKNRSIEIKIQVSLCFRYIQFWTLRAPKTRCHTGSILVFMEPSWAERSLKKSTKHVSFYCTALAPQTIAQLRARKIIYIKLNRSLKKDSYQTVKHQNNKTPQHNWEKEFKHSNDGCHSHYKLLFPSGDSYRFRYGIGLAPRQWGCGGGQAIPRRKSKPIFCQKFTRS